MGSRPYCITTDDGLALMVDHNFEFDIPEQIDPVLAFIIRAEEVADCLETPATSLRFHIVGSDAEALQWFERLKTIRPWEQRQ